MTIQRTTALQRENETIMNSEDAEFFIDNNKLSDAVSQLNFPMKKFAYVGMDNETGDITFYSLWDHGENFIKQTFNVNGEFSEIGYERGITPETIGNLEIDQDATLKIEKNIKEMDNPDEKNLTLIERKEEYRADLKKDDRQNVLDEIKEMTLPKPHSTGTKRTLDNSKKLR